MTSKRDWFGFYENELMAKYTFRIDVYITKKEKRSIFLCDDQEACRCIPVNRRTSPSRRRRRSETPDSDNKEYEPIAKMPKNCNEEGRPTSFQGILTQKTAVI